MHRVDIPLIGAAKVWRDKARTFLASGTRPEDILWGDVGSDADLFADPTTTSASGTVTVPGSFVALANTVVWHKDPERFARLYGFLWRLRNAPHLMTDRGDADLARLRKMEKNVHRCQHKMKAFVRFREIGAPDAKRRSFAAWFEPTHHTVEPTATFFQRRFGDMDWRIFTPDVTAVFENGRLSFTEGQSRPNLPDDASEDLWVTYFRNIFNPARLKVKAMTSEMPKKYWKNMPEAVAIPDLIAGAPARAHEMAKSAPTLPPKFAVSAQAKLAEIQTPWRGPSEELPASISACQRCALHCHATQAVLGEGPSDAEIMIVGEQPGDLEDLSGRPFVGPAGQLFDKVALAAGLDREKSYVTNAVKHFKFTPRGKRRIHQRPNVAEIEHCRWWLDAELAQVAPALVIALGSTAAKALTGNGSAIMSRRGLLEKTLSGHAVLITMHPSYLLRLSDPLAKSEATAAFCDDLKAARRFLREAA